MEEMGNRIPSNLYRYCKFDIEGHYKSLLEKNILFFSSPKSFNDPFDCMVYPFYERGSDKNLLKKMEEMISDEDPNISASEIKKRARVEYFKNKNIIRNPELMVERVKKEISEKYGIVSFSEIKTNLLMWSHYSESHSGFCVEFDTAKIQEVADNYLSAVGHLILFHDVIYVPEYYVIDPYKTSFNVNEFSKMIRTKSDIWIYEKEWRLVYYNHPNETLKLPDGIIKAVYFGVNCSEKIIEECKGLVSSKKVIPIFYRAKLLPRVYGLEFEKIN